MIEMCGTVAINEAEYIITRNDLLMKIGAMKMSAGVSSEVQQFCVKCTQQSAFHLSRTGRLGGDVPALIRSHVIGLRPF